MPWQDRLCTTIVNGTIKDLKKLRPVLFENKEKINVNCRVISLNKNISVPIPTHIPSLSHISWHSGGLGGSCKGRDFHWSFLPDHPPPDGKEMLSNFTFNLPVEYLARQRPLDRQLRQNPPDLFPLPSCRIFEKNPWWNTSVSIFSI